MFLHVREPRRPSDLARWSGELDRLVQNIWPATSPGARRRNFAFEVVPDEHGVRLRANVPGLDASAITVSVEGRALTISGCRQAEQRQNGSYRMRERVFGSFSHTFHLAEDLDVDAIDASCRDGVLTVHVPKRAQAQPRQIEIKVS
jgi:HSP20 family protein